MKSRINNKQEFHDLEKHIKENKSYNVTILEAKVRETGFTEKQIEQIAQIIATTVPPLIEAALVPINKRLDRLEDFANKQLAFNELLLSLPTIKKEIAESKNQK